jgi:hypothetical protein
MDPVEQSDSVSGWPKAPVDKTFRPFDPDQVLLLPPSLDDWLPAEHLARFIAEVVDEYLDLTRIRASYTEGRGAPPYDPRFMVPTRAGSGRAWGSASRSQWRDRAGLSPASSCAVAWPDDSTTSSPRRQRHATRWSPFEQGFAAVVLLGGRRAPKRWCGQHCCPPLGCLSGVEDSAHR